MDIDIRNTGRVGPKETVREKKVVCSSSHPLVTQTILEVLKGGGNAVDAAITGCLLQAVIEPHMTNHAGTAEFLYWDAKSARAYQLNGTGTLVPDLPPFRPVPGIGIRFAGVGANPCACIPGFMSALGEMHTRFGTKGWAELCEPAVRAAEQGHVMNSFEHATLTEELAFYTFFPAGRRLFTPDGFLPEVGDLFTNPDLARTLQNLAIEGPPYFTEGEWARSFVKIANEMGWPIRMSHMSANPPRWQEPLRYRHGLDEIIQLSPPERTGVFTAFVLGVMGHLDWKSLGHYSESAETLYLLAHTMRRAHLEMGLLYDPELFRVPVETWLSENFQQMNAEILWNSRPKRDLSEHVRLTSGYPALAQAGLPAIDAGSRHSPAGSCELSIVDEQGNWLQMMNTLQSGGIPGAVVEGVPMVGSHARTNLQADIAGWYAGGRIRCIIGSTIVVRDGKPRLALGSPGNVYGTVPQVLGSILDYGMQPDQAVDLPRLDPLRDDYVLEVESRLPGRVVLDLLKYGIQIQPLPMYDYNMGSYQVCWKDTASGLLSSCADPRRAGQADGY
jgi:gamma-glutamyltranspeptidase / glutathione hydrolase